MADICRHADSTVDVRVEDGAADENTAATTAADVRTGTTTATGTGNGSPGATLSWAGWIATSTARRAGCDAHTTFVTLNRDGEVIEAGTQRRFFTPAQRRAIIGRDGDRCPAPYCDRPITWSDAYHLTPRTRTHPATTDHPATAAPSPR